MSAGGEDKNDPLNSAPPGRAFEEAASQYHEGLGEPGTVKPSYQPKEGETATQQGSNGSVIQKLESFEAPLKAVNRLIAGIPIVGRPLSGGAQKLWHSLKSQSGSKS